MGYVTLLPLLLSLHAINDPVASPAPNPAWVQVSFAQPSARRDGMSPNFSVSPATFEAAVQGTSAPVPVAMEYSHGYEVRLRIHRYSSFAMLPLFVAEAVVGEKLFHNPSAQGLRTTHGALNVGILGLFGVDTVTGLWNLREGWQDPHGRVRRIVHSLLMLTADVGFVATGVLAPNRRAVEANGSAATTHRNVAVASISVATAGYLIMIFR